MCVCVCVHGESTRENGTYSEEKKLRVLVDRGCNGDVTTLADNY